MGTPRWGGRWRKKKREDGKIHQARRMILISEGKIFNYS